MNRRKIKALYNKIQQEAERIVFDAIAESCRKNRTNCVTNGPFGGFFYRTKDKPSPGYSFNNGRWSRDIDTPKGVEALITWYEDMFGPISQAINKKGEWV